MLWCAPWEMMSHGTPKNAITHHLHLYRPNHHEHRHKERKERKGHRTLPLLRPNHNSHHHRRCHHQHREPDSVPLFFNKKIYLTLYFAPRSSCNQLLHTKQSITPSKQLHQAMNYTKLYFTPRFQAKSDRDAPELKEPLNLNLNIKCIRIR